MVVDTTAVLTSSWKKMHETAGWPEEKMRLNSCNLTGTGSRNPEVRNISRAGQRRWRNISE
jgi:hypothetical protein